MKPILGLTLILLSLGAFAQSTVGPIFQQLAELTGTQAGTDFGYAIAVSGNTLVVGVPLSSDICNQCGVAYVYTATNGDWTNLIQVATLSQTEESEAGGFGNAVAISGNTIVVAGFDSSTQQAAAYVYVNPSGNSTQTAELTTSNVDTNGGAIDEIAFDGNIIVIGTPFALPVEQREGAAFVYVQPSTGWADMSQTAELVSQEPNTIFGASVGISGRNIIVGATEVQIAGVDQGAAYLFVEPSQGWSGTRFPTTEFEASNGTRKAGFGTAVSASGETMAVGAPYETTGSDSAEGAIYIFTRPSTGWPKTMTETAELTAGNAGGKLGYSLVLNGKELAAGAPGAHSNQGVVYAFTEPSGGWQNHASAREIIAADGAANNNFGLSVSFGGGVIVAGALGWPNGGLDPSGAVYIFGNAQ